MNKLIQIKAKIRLGKEKSAETAQIFYLFLLKKHCLSLHPVF